MLRRHGGFLAGLGYLAFRVISGDHSRLLLMLVYSLIGLAVALFWAAWYEQECRDLRRMDHQRAPQDQPPQPKGAAARSAVPAGWSSLVYPHRGLSRAVIGVALLGFALSSGLWFSRLLVLSRFIESQGVRGYMGH